MASQQVRKEIFDLTSGCCYYCGCLLEFETFEIDHVTPKSKNGKDHNNRVPACHDCNACKYNLDVEEFRNKIKYLLVSSCKNKHHLRIMNKYYPDIVPDISFWFERMALDDARR